MEHAGAGAKEIDLIVMNVRMPEIDGIEACRRIKEVEALRDIPIIMIIARSQQEALRAAFDAGATDYIKKPFEEVELLARIKAAFKLKKVIYERKNWEQELSKTISELDAALHEISLCNNAFHSVPLARNCWQTRRPSPPSKPISRSTPMPSSTTRSVPVV
jgi:DNA-binding response OmpR family regulator